MKKKMIITIIMFFWICIISTQVQAMEIYVKMLDTTNITIEVEPNDTIESLKLKIYEEKGIPVEQIELIYTGKQLEDEKTLSEYNIQRDSTIHLIIRSSQNFKVKYNIINLNETTNNVTSDENLEDNSYTYTISGDNDFSAKLESQEGYKLPESITVKIGNDELDTAKYTYDSETGEIVIPKENITGEIITIEATALKITYKLTLDSNEGEFSDGKTKLEFDDVTKCDMTVIEEPIKEGYIFKGWYTEKNGGTSIEIIMSSEEGINEDIIFYAQWEEKSTSNESNETQQPIEENNNNELDNNNTGNTNSGVDNNTELVNNPQTSDNILIYVVMLLTSVLGIIVITNIRKNKIND